MVQDIWDNGYEIEREGQKITLTRDEIRDIYNSIKASNGRGSIEYFMDTIWDPDEEDAKYLDKAKEKIDDVNFCLGVWEDFMDYLFDDSGEAECEAVRYNIIEELNSEGENE